MISELIFDLDVRISSVWSNKSCLSFLLCLHVGVDMI